MGLFHERGQMKLKTIDPRIGPEISELLKKLNKYCRKPVCDEFSQDCQACDLRYTAKGNYSDGPGGMECDSVHTCLKEALKHAKKGNTNG